jgi:hypothetical protein
LDKKISLNDKMQGFDKWVYEDNNIDEEKKD